jgi:hypothetical protein
VLSAASASRLLAYFLSGKLAPDSSQSNNQVLKTNHEIQNLVTNQGTAIGVLLNRTNVSRRRRPNSILTSDQGSERVSIISRVEPPAAFEFDDEIRRAYTYQRVGNRLIELRGGVPSSIIYDTSLASLSLNIVGISDRPAEPLRNTDPGSRTPPEQIPPIVEDDFINMWKDYQDQHFRQRADPPPLAERLPPQGEEVQRMNRSRLANPPEPTHILETDQSLEKLRNFYEEIKNIYRAMCAEIPGHFQLDYDSARKLDMRRRAFVE